MNVIQNLITDLREKRLWPVAVALVLALIVVPVLLSGGGNKSVPVAQVPPAGSSGAPVPALPAVSVTTTPSNARITGRERNPFEQQVKQKSGSGAAASTPAGSSAGNSGSSGGSSAAANETAPPDNSANAAPTNTTTTTTTTTPTTTKPVTKYSYFAVNVVYDHVGSVPKTLDNIARLTPLPGASDPQVVYLGVANDKKTAVFFVSKNVHPTGQGKCLPSRSDCQFLDLKAGQADLFKVVRHSATYEFTLSLTSVKLMWTKSLNVSTKANARASKAGTKIMARATKRSLALHLLVYSERTGTLSVDISRRLVEHLVRTLGMQAALGVTLQPVTTGS